MSTELTTVMQIVTKYSYPRRNVKIQRFVSDVTSSVVENSNLKYECQTVLDENRYTWYSSFEQNGDGLDIGLKNNEK